MSPFAGMANDKISIVKPDWRLKDIFAACPFVRPII
jgi:hypothetical protein